MRHRYPCQHDCLQVHMRMVPALGRSTSFVGIRTWLALPVGGLAGYWLAVLIFFVDTFVFTVAWCCYGLYAVPRSACFFWNPRVPRCFAQPDMALRIHEHRHDVMAFVVLYLNYVILECFADLAVFGTGRCVGKFPSIRGLPFYVATW